MKVQRFKSRLYLVYIITAAMVFIFFLGYKQNGPYTLNADFLETLIVAFAVIFLTYLSTITTYLEIQDNRTLINSGYWTFGRIRVDVYHIKYIYRYQDFVVKWFGGARMVFYAKDDSTGKLTSTAVREINYSNEVVINFLTRLKEINPNIELDPEYEHILKGDLDVETKSENTVESVEARLREKGEKW